MAAAMHYDYIFDQYYGLQVCFPYPDFKYCIRANISGIGTDQVNRENCFTLFCNLAIVECPTGNLKCQIIILT